MAVPWLYNYPCYQQPTLHGGQETPICAALLIKCLSHHVLGLLLSLSSVEQVVKEQEASWSSTKAGMGTKAVVVEPPWWQQENQQWEESWKIPESGQGKNLGE